MSSILDGNINLTNLEQNNPNNISYNPGKAANYCSSLITAMGLPITHNWNNLCLTTVNNFLSNNSTFGNGYISYIKHLNNIFYHCGNKVIDKSLGEECDDGNTINGDGCNNKCLAENTDCLNNPFSVGCVNYCKVKTDKIGCITNFCNNKYGNDPLMANVLADCVSSTRMSFNGINYLIKTSYNCLPTNDNPLASPTSTNCILAAGGFLNDKTNIIKSFCKIKYGNDYVGAYNCQLQANYQTYCTINTLVNCSNLTESQDNITRCLSYINRSLAYENKNNNNYFRDRVDEICRLVGNCDSPINFNLIGVTKSSQNNNNKTTSNENLTPRSLLLSSSTNFLSGTCVDHSGFLNYQLHDGLYYLGLKPGNIPANSLCAVSCPYNKDGTYGGDSCSNLIKQGGDYYALRPDVAAIVDRCGGEDVPMECRQGLKNLIEVKKMCDIKDAACDGKCSVGNEKLPACCAAIIEPTATEITIKNTTTTIYKINLNGQDITGDKDFLDKLARAYSNMMLAKSKDKNECVNPLPNGCSFSSSYHSDSNSKISSHELGLAVDICCQSKEDVDQLTKDFFSLGEWGYTIIREATEFEKKCNNTKDCNYLIHLDTKSRPNIKTPCYVTEINYSGYKSYSSNESNFSTSSSCNWTGCTNIK